MKKYSDFESFGKDQAYWERNQLVCALSKIYPSWMELHPISDKDWDKDWRHIVFITIPSKVSSGNLKYSPGAPLYFNKDLQLSWHIHDSEIDMFRHLQLKSGNSWDGHTTEEKYQRLSDLRVKKWYQFWK